MADKEQMVLTALQNAGKPLRPGDVAELTGIDKDEVSKIITKLKKDGKVMSPQRCCWAPV